MGGRLLIDNAYNDRPAWGKVAALVCVVCVLRVCDFVFALLFFLFCFVGAANAIISFHTTITKDSCVPVCVCTVTFKLRLGNCFAASSSSSSLSSEPVPESLRLPTWTMDTQQNYEARVENKTI